MRDYLDYEDAIYFDRRENCKTCCHYMKLKNDFINIFYFHYSFAPYAIRIIKFAFFFHFMFYLETLCIGQEYYFNKYYSKEFQEFLRDNTFSLYNTESFNSTNNVNDSRNNSIFSNIFDVENIELTRIHYLYTFKYAFPRVLIPAAISLISYIFTSILSPRRRIMKILLNIEYKTDEKNNKINKITKCYKIIFIIFGVLALLLLIFFFYSNINYFYVFEDAKYDIPQSFLLSGLLRFIFDIILWAFMVELRVCSMEIRHGDAYNLINKLYEMN